MNSSNFAEPIPCRTIDDFYATSGRRAIKRVLEQWLAAQTLTAIEFIHNAAALEKFENAGTSYQHAIQRMAVTLAGRTKQPVVQIIRKLTDLTTAAMNRVYTDNKDGRFPALDAGAILARAEALEGEPSGLYVLNGILAKYLASAKTWDAKLSRVLALHSEAQRREQEGADTLLWRACEALTVEIVEDTAILPELLGAKAGFAKRLFGAIGVLNGRPESTEGVAESLLALSRRFARGELRDARLALANYVRAECESPKRLRPDSAQEDLAAFRELAGELQSVPATYLHPEDIAEVFVKRSKRFTTPEALAQLTADAASPDEKLDCVLGFESVITGAANKRALSLYALSLVTAHNFESAMAVEYRGIPKLRRLADLQARILNSGLSEPSRQEMAALLDGAASRLETQGRYLAGVDARIADPAERVETYLRLFAAGVFTQGLLVRKARRALLLALAQPGFASRYAERREASPHDAIMQLVEQLKANGITPEESLRAMAPD